MKREIIIKNNNKLFTNTFELNKGTIVYDDDDHDKVSYNLNIAINGMLKSLFKYNNNQDFLKRMVNDIKSVHSVDDIENIIINFIAYYKCKSAIVDKSKLNLVINNVVERRTFITNKLLFNIIDLYYEGFFKKFNNDQLFNIFLMNGVEFDNFLNDNAESINKNSNSDLERNINNYLDYSIKENFYNNLLKNKKTLCWDCPSNVCLNCPKVEFKEKKFIKDYNFISDGVQVFENGELKRFPVFGCKKAPKKRKKLS